MVDFMLPDDGLIMVLLLLPDILGFGISNGLGRVDFVGVLYTAIWDRLAMGQFSI